MLFRSKVLPQTLIIVLASSLFVALIINPPFIASYMRLEDIRQKFNWKKQLMAAGIIAAVSIPFYLLRAFIFANILMTVVLLITLNLAAFRPLARWFQTRFLVMLERLYTRQLRHALRGYNPAIYFAGTVLLLIFSGMFYFSRSPKVVFFPETDPQTVYITMELPLGTSIERTDQVSRQVEEIINSTLAPYKGIVKSVDRKSVV